MFNINIPFYVLAIFLALISNILVVINIAKKYKDIYNNKEIICLLLYENFGIIYGAKVLFYLLSYKDLNHTFNFVDLGFKSYGAMLGALLFILLFCIQFHKPIKETLFMFIPSFPLMYSIGKIGCFLVGCCYGIEYNGPFRIMYQYSNNAPNDIYLFPVQLVESILFFIVFIYLIFQHKKNRFNLKKLSIATIFSGLIKFCLDFLRMSHSSFFSCNQVISLLLIVFGGITLIYYSKVEYKNKM